MSATVWGIFLAALGAVFFALGSQLQHHAVNRRTPKASPHRKSTGFLRQPLWFVGLAAVVVGCLIHLGAVALAPISLIQPIGALSVPITAAMTWFLARLRPQRSEIVALALCLVAISVFATLAAHWVSEGTDILANSGRFWVGAGVVGTLAVGLFFLPSLGHKAKKNWPRYLPLAWGCGAGMLYGLATTGIKWAFLQAPGVAFLQPFLPASLSRASAATPPPGSVGAGAFVATLVLIALCYVLGIWAVQQGFALAPPHLMVACLTVCDPLVALALGLLVLGEGAALTPAQALTLVAVGIVLLGSLFVLARASEMKKTVPPLAAPGPSSPHSTEPPPRLSRPSTEPPPPKPLPPKTTTP